MGYKKTHLTYSYREFHVHYTKACKKSEVYKPLEIKKYRAYLYDVFNEIFEEIIKNGFHFVLPFGLGDIYLKRSQLRGLYKKKYRNSHTLGATFELFWDTTYRQIDNLKYYAFSLTPETKKRLNKFYKEDVASGDHKIPEPYNHPLKEMIDFE